MSQILLVEDNESIVMGLTYLLTEEQYTIDTAERKSAAMEKLKTKRYDLILLDISLPDGSGFELCRYIKKELDVPVIFLTAKDEERDVVEGFDLGADDYIIKPFRNRELISRIKNVLRRSGKDNSVLEYHNIRIDTLAGKVYHDKEEIVLTKLEYKILVILFGNPRKLFTREEILSSIWDIDGNFVNDNTLTVYMKRIREKIGDQDGKIIETVRGMGYRLYGDKK